MKWYDLKNIYDSEKCIFWVGAGISRNSGAPCAPELSNKLVYTLCKNNQSLKDEIYGEKIDKNKKPISLVAPWRVLAENINIINNHMILSEPRTKSYLRLETVLECIRQIVPNMVVKLFNPFNKLEPNIVHFSLASALKRGHSVITTNWDTLIEQAAEKLNIPFNIRIWNPEKRILERINEKTHKAGTLYKIHGTLSEKNEFLAFINQFVWGIPEDVKREFLTILKDRMIICLGYSFSDFFDYDVIFKNLTDYNSRLFIIQHEENLKICAAWRKLSADEYPLSFINCEDKKGIWANTECFAKYFFEEKKMQSSFATLNIINEMTNVLERCEAEQKQLIILRILVLLGKVDVAHVFLNKILYNINSAEWAQILTQVQIFYKNGKTNEALKSIDLQLKHYEDKNLIKRLELLDRACETSLNDFSLFSFIKYYWKSTKVFQYARKKYFSNHELQSEINNRYRHLDANITAILSKAPTPIRFTLKICQSCIDIIQKKSPKNEYSASEYFLMDIKIYSDRSKALKQKDYSTVAYCYKSYLEMGDIDGSLGALIDLALFSIDIDIKLANKIKCSISEVIDMKFGSIYAKAKFHALNLGLNDKLDQRNLYVKVLFTLFSKKFYQYILRFDSWTGRFVWLYESIKIYCKTIKSLKKP